MPNPLGDIHSTGRGGAGNIGHDPNTYIDAEIIREGQSGVSAESEYSSGRGGAGNMVSSKPHPPVGQSDGVHTAGGGPRAQGGPLGGVGRSDDIIPEPAMRPGAGHDDFHTGRGGAGNEYREKYGGHSGPQKEHHHPEGHGVQGLVDKAKHLVGLDKEKAK